MLRITIISALAVICPALAFADGASARISAYNEIAACAAQVVGLENRTQVDVSLPANHFFGDNPALYNRCAVPRLKAAGLKAQKLSLLDYGNLGPQELASLINEIALRSLE
ncbi:MAG: hypothetical protein ACXWQO_18910 [Bdellovibrionota bacterium]